MVPFVAPPTAAPSKSETLKAADVLLSNRSSISFNERISFEWIDISSEPCPIVRLRCPLETILIPSRINSGERLLYENTPQIRPAYSKPRDQAHLQMLHRPKLQGKVLNADHLKGAIQKLWTPFYLWQYLKFESIVLLQKLKMSYSLDS